MALPESDDKKKIKDCSTQKTNWCHRRGGRNVTSVSSKNDRNSGSRRLDIREWHPSPTEEAGLPQKGRQLFNFIFCAAQQRRSELDYSIKKQWCWNSSSLIQYD